MAIYFSKKVLDDNDPNNYKVITPQQVYVYKNATCDFIMSVGRYLELPQSTIATALVYCQRLYSCKAITSARFSTAMASVWLATQVEHNQVSLHRIIHTCFFIKNRNDINRFTRLSKPEFTNTVVNKVFRVQMEIYQACCKCLKYEHPYIYSFTYLRYFLIKKSITEQQYNDLYYATFNLINDSFKTQLCIQYEPEKIAVSVVLLAGRLLDVSLNSSLMLKIAKMDMSIVEDICSQFLEHFEREYFTDKEKIEGRNIFNSKKFDIDENKKAQDETNKRDGRSKRNKPYKKVGIGGSRSLRSVGSSVLEKKIEVDKCFEEIFGLDNNKETDSGEEC